MEGKAGAMVLIISVNILWNNFSLCVVEKDIPCIKSLFLIWMSYCLY